MDPRNAFPYLMTASHYLTQYCLFINNAWLHVTEGNFKETIVDTTHR